MIQPIQIKPAHILTSFNSWESDNIYLSDIQDPRLLAVRSSASKYNEDNPTWEIATKGTFQAEFWQAMRVELNTLVNEFK